MDFVEAKLCRPLQSDGARKIREAGLTPCPRPPPFPPPVVRIKSFPLTLPVFQKDKRQRFSRVPIYPTQRRYDLQACLAGGFSDYLTAPDEAIVMFHGNGYTSIERVIATTALRCAEVTLAHGYRYFV